MGYDEGSTGRATMLLAGPREAQIDVHAAGEAGARLTILWAVGMLTFTTSYQVRALADALGESAGSRTLVPDRAARGLFDQFVPRYGVTRIAATLGQTPQVSIRGVLRPTPAPDGLGHRGPGCGGRVAVVGGGGAHRGRVVVRPRRRALP